MNAAHFMAQAAMRIACTQDIRTGRAFDFTGRDMAGCHECAGCDSVSRDQELGVIDGMTIVSHSGTVRLCWPCPSCGTSVSEDTVPITAIDHAAEISKDPLCFSCRKKRRA